MLELEELLDSWLAALRGARKARTTIRGYQNALRSFLDYCDETGRPAELTKENVIAWLGASPLATSTLRLRLAGIKTFARWLAEEEGFDAAPILAIKGPRQDQPVVAHLSDKEVRALIRACDGPTLLDRRDKAMVILLAETGLRASELLALDVPDVSISDLSLTVRKGKGGKGRRVRFSATAAVELDRYLRARRKAGYPAASGPLWMSSHLGRLSYHGLRWAIVQRARAAGIEGFHLHRLRHTMATRWLAQGGSEAGLMSQAGWSSRAMIDRYTRAAREKLAADEFDRLDMSFQL